MQYNFLQVFIRILSFDIKIDQILPIFDRFGQSHICIWIRNSNSRFKIRMNSSEPSFPK